MRKLLVIFLSTLFLISIGNAQDSKEKRTLIPYIEWLTKKTSETKKSKNLLSDGGFGIFFKSSKLPVDFSIEIMPIRIYPMSIVLSVSMTARELIFVDTKQVPQATINYFLRIYSKDRSVDGIIDEQVSIDVDENTLATRANEFPIVYRRIVTLPKGKYVSEFLIKDIQSGSKATKKIKFEIK